MNESSEIRRKMHELIKKFIRGRKKGFRPRETKVRYSGGVYDERELVASVDALLDGWFGEGKNAEKFERELAGYLGVKECILTNSGSSANLVAISSLVSQQLDGRIERGSEVLTPATTFPTTFNPIIQCGLIPVVLDVELGTYNINAEVLRDAVNEKTKLIMLPHMLGNPNEMDAVMELAEERGIHVVEDSCDALGSKYRGKKVGSFGDFGTFSFYPAHHITTCGEGGAISTKNLKLARIARCIRSWGRACYCKWNEKNPNGACGMRFEFKLDGIPYDHKYMYIDIGYNLKMTEVQAAFGVEQLKKLEEFIKIRKRNFKKLLAFFSDYEEYFILPEATPNSDPAWFAFPLTIRDGVPFDRNSITKWLERNRIETRLMFAGNIIKQPAYKNVRYKVFGKLNNSDKIMRDTFFIGVYPGIDDEMLNYVFEKVEEFLRRM
jgi:CDP-6-deoxy-D-xylo-4-hexulose-3-dehydrase